MATTPDPSPISRRSFSLPIARESPSSGTQIEVLYTLNSARIVDFVTSSSQGRPGSSHGVPSAEDEVGKLSWISPRERTIAVGPLRIYRAPGSVAFLNCANALRPILPKSQVWCVDGDSKFVLQVRRPQYWRIEVSNKSDDEKRKVDELKKVLGEILLFEKTPCPFQRDFEVELPEVPLTPVTKRPWKPVQGPRPQTPTGQEAAIEFGYGSPAFARRASSASPMRQSLLSNSRRNSELDLGSRFASDSTRNQDSKSSTPPNEITDIIIEAEEASSTTIIALVPVETTESEQPEANDVEKPSNEVIQSLEQSLETTQSANNDDSDESEATDETTRPSRRISLNLSSPTNNAREDSSIAEASNAPPPALPNLSIVTTEPVNAETISSLKSAVSDSESISSSIDSWHSLSPTDSEPSSPIQSFAYADDEIVVGKRHSLRTGPEGIATDSQTRTWDISTTPAAEADRSDLSFSPEPHTPTLTHDSDRSEDDHFEIVTPPTARAGVRHRATTSSNSRRRQLSPLPAAVNLFSPSRSRPRHLQTARHLPTAIIQKTCEILLSPPSHLFHMMINIASKIAAGEWRGVLLGHGEAVHWDFEDEYIGQSWHEDDYGVKLREDSRDTKSQSNSWEVD